MKRTQNRGDVLVVLAGLLLIASLELTALATGQDGVMFAGAVAAIGSILGAWLGVWTRTRPRRVFPVWEHDWGRSLPPPRPRFRSARRVR